MSVFLYLRLAIVEAGAIPLLVDLLVDLLHSSGSNDSRIITAAEGRMRLLYSQTATTTLRRPSWMEAGMVPLLVTRLSGGLGHSREQAAVALEHLAASNHTIGKTIAEAGAIPPLVDMLGSGSWYTSRPAAAEALGFLIEGNDDIAAAVVKAGAIPPLVALLERRFGGSAPRPLPNDREGGREAARALCNLTLHDAGRHQAEGRGYTRTRLRELQAKFSSPWHKRGWLLDW